MTTTSDTSVRDRLLAQTELAQHRLETFRSTLARTSAEVRASFDVQVERVAQRCEDLGWQIRNSPDIEIGAATAVDDLGAAVDTLEADLDAATEAQADAYRSAVDRQLRAWRGRAESFRLQGSLGVMELRDDFDHIGDRISDARGAVLVELRRAADDAKDVVVDVRDDLEDVLVDVRHAIERAADALVGPRTD